MNAPLVDLNGEPLSSVGLRSRAGGFEAGSTRHVDMMRWMPRRHSSRSAIGHDLDRIVGRVQDLVRNDGWASAGVSRLVDNVIGSGFRLSARINGASLGIEQEAANDLATAIETEWREFADDVDCFCDAGRRFNIGMLTGLAFRHRILDGEALGRIRWIPGRGGRFGTAVEVIDPARLSTPQGRTDNARLQSGIELGANGEPVRYHIQTSHPADSFNLQRGPKTWTPVRREKPWGRRIVLHAFEPNAAGQVRGEPVLAPIVRKLKQISRYDEAELGAATLNAILAAFIESPMDPEMLASSIGGNELSAYQKERMAFYNENPVSLPGVQVTHLHHGEKATLTTPAHPNPAFEGFSRVALRNIASTVGLTYEQLTMDWSQVNYSSARAALLEVWRGLTARKNNFVFMWLMPIYAAFLEECFERHVIELPQGATPFRSRKNAYCAAHWIGPGRGWVDPLKEALAAEKRVDAGFSTLEQEAADQGRDWQELIIQRAREEKALKDAQLTRSPGSSTVIVYGEENEDTQRKETGNG